jgi:hypothetical protein
VDDRGGSDRGAPFTRWYCGGEGKERASRCQEKGGPKQSSSYGGLAAIVVASAATKILASTYFQERQHVIHEHVRIVRHHSLFHSLKEACFVLMVIDDSKVRSTTIRSQICHSISKSTFYVILEECGCSCSA